MARVDLDQPLQPSVLDRLLDDQPDKSVDPPKSRGQSLAELRAAVRRDLEILLNTRHRCRSWHSDLKELKGSLVNYGIPEFTSANMASDTTREEFRFAIEEVIKRCEPRFQTVEVVLLDNADRLDRTIRFPHRGPDVCRPGARAGGIRFGDGAVDPDGPGEEFGPWLTSFFPTTIAS